MLIQALTKVLRRPVYTALAIIVSMATFAFAVWLPNLGLLWSIFGSYATFGEKIRFAATLLGSIGTDFTIFSASYTIVFAILFGIYVALLVCLIRERVTASGGNVAIGAGGILSAFFGIGCAACGSFLLMTLFGWAGSATLLRFLPLGGQEFGLLGIAFLLLALYFTARKIHRSTICIP